MIDWLLVIDMQPAFGRADSPWHVPGYKLCAERIATLVDHFGDQVLFTRFVPPAAPEGAWRGYYDRWPFATDPAHADLWDLDPRWRGRTSVASPRFSKWAEAAPRLPDGTRLMLCGVATDCCVLGTAVEAVDAGRELHIVTDACAAGTPALHNAALAVLAERAPMARLVSTEDALAPEL